MILLTIKFNDREILHNTGKISHDVAKEYNKFMLETKKIDSKI